MRLAMTSLPVPLSPVTSTLEWLSLMTRTKSNTARMRALRPTTTSSSGKAFVACLDASSDDLQLLELPNLLAQGHLDAHVERHVRARASGAHPGQPDLGAVALDLEQLDVATVGLQEGTDPLEHSFPAFSTAHAWLPLGPAGSVPGVLPGRPHTGGDHPPDFQQPPCQKNGMGRDRNRG